MKVFTGSIAPPTHEGGTGTPGGIVDRARSANGVDDNRLLHIAAATSHARRTHAFTARLNTPYPCAARIRLLYGVTTNVSAALK